MAPDTRAMDAGHRILKEGGTAADAAIAASAVLGVVLPHTCGLGGDVVALVHPTEAPPEVVLGIGTSGSGASSEPVRDLGVTTIPRTHSASVIIPGALDGWLELHRRYGRLPLGVILADAIAYADDGFALSDELRVEIEETPWSNATDELPAVLIGADLDHGHWERPRLARLLRQIVEEGRSALYRGHVGDDIVEASEGLIAPADMASDQFIVESPLTFEFEGFSILVPGSPTQGAVLGDTVALMMACGALDEADVADGIHLMIESYRAIAQDSITRALAPGRIDRESVPRPQRRRVAIRRPAVGILGGTAYLAACDSEGLLISMSQSNYYRMGSGRFAKSAGLPLNNRGGGFSLEPGHVNELRPTARPFHTLIPAIVRDGKTAVSALGTRGGLLQPQILMQVLFWSLHSGTPLEANLGRPRLNVRPEVANSLVFAEAAFPHEVLDRLTMLGHRIVMRADAEPSWGPALALTVRGGRAFPGIDPRSAMGDSNYQSAGVDGHSLT